MLYENLLKPLFFTQDPEFVHEAVLNILSKIGSYIPRASVNDAFSLGTKIAGIHFPNKIGLAAGMDKACTAPLAWQGLGFGFIEIGTITNHAQEGNLKPRLFRLPAEKSLLNRLGFNNAGSAEIAKRLNKVRREAKLQIPLGLNIGKSRIIDPKDSEKVIDDYKSSIHKLQVYTDYLTINVSSPNTPGLREWESPEQLEKLLTPLRQIADKPLFLKISPDMQIQALEQVLDIAQNLNLAGIIATNTTISRENTPQWAQFEMGGISGALLKEKSLNFTREITKRKNKKLALISVGGISSTEDIKQRLELGADLVQIYTALIYEGPDLISKLNKALAN